MPGGPESKADRAGMDTAVETLSRTEGARADAGDEAIVAPDDSPPSSGVWRARDGIIVLRGRPQWPVVSPARGFGALAGLGVLYFVVAGIAGPVAAASVLAAIVAIVLWPWHAEIEVDRNTLFLTQGPFGLSVRSVPLADLDGVRVRRGGTSLLGGALAHADRYCLSIGRTGSHPIDIGSSLDRSEEDFDWVARQVTHAIWLERDRRRTSLRMSGTAPDRAALQGPVIGTDVGTIEEHGRVAVSGTETIAVPPCEGCGSKLVADGKGRVCPRCGRAFSVAIVRREASPVYREVPTAAELVPVRDRVLKLGMEIGAPERVLDVRLGSPWTTFKHRSRVGHALVTWFIGSFGLAYAVSALKLAGGGVFFVVVMSSILGSGLSYLVLSRGVRHRLIVEDGMLR